LSDSDGTEAPRVAVISKRMADRWWPGERSVLGKRFRVTEMDGEQPWMTIVGVVGDVPHQATDRDPRPVVYVPYLQAPRLWLDVGVRTAGDPMRLAPAIIAAVRSIDAEQPVTDIATMETLRHRNALGLNYVAVMMAIFGVLALVLAAVGVYGVMAYLVSEQTHEIGIRMALGAPRGTVLSMMLRRGLVTASIGVVVGLAISYQMARLLASLVFGVSANDFATFAGIPLALILTAAIAIYLPARRATRIDPLIALRHQ